MTTTKLMMIPSTVLLVGVAAWGALGAAALAPNDRATPLPVLSAGELIKPVLAIASTPAPQGACARRRRPDDFLPVHAQPRQCPRISSNNRQGPRFRAEVGTCDCRADRMRTWDDRRDVDLATETSLSPEKDKSIRGTFRAVVLRFSPADQPAIISLGTGKRGRDVGAVEMSRQMLQTAIRHCYHRSMEVLIPSKGALAAVIYWKGTWRPVNLRRRQRSRRVQLHDQEQAVRAEVGGRRGAGRSSQRSPVL